MSESLKLISGMVNGLTVHAGEEEFVRSARQQAASVGTAATLALEGVSGAAAGAGMAASSAGDPVEFFTCKIGEQSVQGRFSKITFKDGEALEMVIASQQNGMPLVLAARRASSKVLWMAPHSSRGRKGHRSFAFLLAWKLFALFLALGLIVILVMEYFSAAEHFKYFEFDLALITALSAIAAPSTPSASTGNGSPSPDKLSKYLLRWATPIHPAWTYHATTSATASPKASAGRTSACTPPAATSACKPKAPR